MPFWPFCSWPFCFWPFCFWPLLIIQLRTRRTSSVLVVWSRVIRTVTPQQILPPRHLYASVSRMVAMGHQAFPFPPFCHRHYWSCCYSVSEMLELNASITTPQNLSHRDPNQWNEKSSNSAASYIMIWQFYSLEPSYWRTWGFTVHGNLSP